MFCRHCGNEMAAEAVVCVKCGVPTGKGNHYCPNCGAETDMQAVVCVKCGVSLEQKKTENSDFDLMESLRSFRPTLDALPWIATFLLVLFADGLFGGIYRATKGDTTGLVIGVVWFVTAGFFGIGALIDLITVIVNKKITFLA